MAPERVSVALAGFVTRPQAEESNRRESDFTCELSRVNSRSCKILCMKTKRRSMITKELIAAVRARFRLDWQGIHGAPHWSRVRLNGLAIAAKNGARPEVIELFAFLHDSCREDDGHDAHHGRRAVDFARKLRGKVYDIDNAGFDLLAFACATHSDGHREGDPTVQACWDADRLDLWRVWTDTDPRRLATQAARAAPIFNEARRRSLAWLHAR